MQHRQLTPDMIRRGAGCLFAGAIVAAPFLALLYGLTAGLVVMICALAATAYLAYDATRTAPRTLHRRLVIVAAINAILALAGVAVLVARSV